MNYHNDNNNNYINYNYNYYNIYYNIRCHHHYQIINNDLLFKAVGVGVPQHERCIWLGGLNTGTL